MELHETVRCLGWAPFPSGTVEFNSVWYIERKKFTLRRQYLREVLESNGSFADFTLKRFISVECSLQEKSVSGLPDEGTDLFEFPGRPLFKTTGRTFPITRELTASKTRALIIQRYKSLLSRAWILCVVSLCLFFSNAWYIWLMMRRLSKIIAKHISAIYFCKGAGKALSTTISRDPVEGRHGTDIVIAFKAVLVTWRVEIRRPCKRFLVTSEALVIALISPGLNKTSNFGQPFCRHGQENEIVKSWCMCMLRPRIFKFTSFFTQVPECLCSHIVTHASVHTWPSNRKFSVSC